MSFKLISAVIGVILIFTVLNYYGLQDNTDPRIYEGYEIFEFPINDEIPYYTVFGGNHSQYFLSRNSDNQTETMIIRNEGNSILHMAIQQQGNNPKRVDKILQIPDYEVLAKLKEDRAIERIYGFWFVESIMIGAGVLAIRLILRHKNSDFPSPTAKSNDWYQKEWERVEGELIRSKKQLN